MITRLDAHVGDLLAQLKELGLDENTLVIFTSDNGPHKEGGPAYDPDFFDANGPFSGIKRSLTDGGIRVPFIARWPGRITAGGDVGARRLLRRLDGDVRRTRRRAAAREPRQPQPRADAARARRAGDARVSLLGVPRRRLQPGRAARGPLEGHPPEVTRGADPGLRPRERPRRDDRCRRPRTDARRAHRRDHARGARGQRALEVARVSHAAAAEPRQADIVVYGGTSGGITAAVQARRMGKSVVIVCPERHLGGLTSGGLGFTDTGDKAVIGGLSREFYHRVWQHYQQPDAWRWQKREEYGNKGQGTPAIDQAAGTMWIFEPHVAERVFEAWVAELKIPVDRDEWLDREQGRPQERRPHHVDHDARRADLLRPDVHRRHLRGRPDGRRRRRLPRRAASRTTAYGEQWNGVQTGVLHHRHHFGVLKAPIRPYVVPGDPTSGVLPRISAEPPGEYGAGRQEGAGLLLPHVPDAGAGEPRPVPEARRLRPEAVRAAAAHLRRRLARDVREVRPDPQPQDRHEQPRPVQHRQHRAATTTTPRPPTSAAARSSRSTRLPEGLALLHRQRSARARRTCRAAMAAWGLAEGRVHRQRPLAAPDLRPRGAADGRATT